MTEIATAQSSVALLDAALDAAGGLERWREYSFLSAHLSQGGGLWGMKGQAGVLDDVDGFVSVGGITLPTRHRIHPRDAADRIDTSNVIVAIDIDDIDDIAFGQP